MLMDFWGWNNFGNNGIVNSGIVNDYCSNWLLPIFNRIDEIVKKIFLWI